MATQATAQKLTGVIDYERVSGERQDLDRQTIELADNRLRFNLDEPIRRVRLKVSGTKVGTKKDWLQMIADVPKPEVKAINISAIDRMFRPKDFAALEMQALQAFADHKKVIISAKEGWVEPWTDEGWKTIMQAVIQAGLEWREIKRRTAGGRRKAHGQNKPMNTTPPYGILYRDKYSRDAEGKAQYFYEDLAPASNGMSRREVVNLCYHWRTVEKLGPGRIATRLNHMGILSAGYRGKGGVWVGPGPWTRQTVRQLLRNKHYIGEHWEGGKQIEVACPTLVERTVFLKSVEMDDAITAASNGRPATVHLLSGFLVCEFCRRAIYSRTGSRRKAAYCCGNVTRDRKRQCARAKQVRCDVLEALVWAKLWAHLTDWELLTRNARAYYDSLPSDQTVANLETELAMLKSRIGRLQDMISAGVGDHQKAIAEMREDGIRILDIQSELRSRGSVMTMPQEHLVKAACERIRDAQREPGTFDERRPILEGLRDFQVVYGAGNVEITGFVPVPAATGADQNKPAHKCNRRVDGAYSCVHYIPFKIKERVA